MKRSLPVIFSLAVAACATPGPEPQPAVEVQAPEPVQVSQSQSAKFETGDIYAHETSSQNSGRLEQMEAPGIEKIPAELIPGRPEAEDAIVCKRITPTGSVLPRKVCFNRSELDQRESSGQRLLRDLKDNTANGASRL